jgi:hypothetical protein
LLQISSVVASLDGYEKTDADRSLARLRDARHAHGGGRWCRAATGAAVGGALDGWKGTAEGILVQLKEDLLSARRALGGAVSATAYQPGLTCLRAALGAGRIDFRPCT